MKKLLCAFLAIAMVAALLSGCSLFASEGEDESKESAGTSPVEITGSFAFENPSDIDFDTRYVLYSDENSPMISSMPEEFGCTGEYMIYYAKDDELLACYDFMICDTPEHTADLLEYLIENGSSKQTAEEDATVIYSMSDRDALEAILITYQGYGIISDTKASTYIDFCVESFGATQLE